ncbi:hypothetical protein LTS12_029532, partial [Elasticomyces elasticus]
MIIRKFGVRQSRQLLAVTRPSRTLSRFYSTETPLETIVQTPPREPSNQPENTLEQAEWKGARLAAEELWEKRQIQKQSFHRLGSEVKDVYDPEDLLRSPPNPADVTLELLLASQTHLGHSTSRWNPQNSRYIFGIRDGVHIISLDVTAAHLRRAAKVVEEVAARGGLILFAGTRDGQKRIV